MSKSNGQCVVGIPLFRAYNVEPDIGMHAADFEYQVVMVSTKPIAWILDCDFERPLFNAEFVDNNFEVIGDL